jgi:hypothetical protein
LVREQFTKVKARAEVADKAEDAQHGPQRRGDETPQRMANKQRRLEHIREGEGVTGSPGGERSGRSRALSGGRSDRLSNFTDGDSRIMPSQGGFIPGYNAQIAVDAAHQVITAHHLSTNPADFSTWCR